MTQRFAKYRKLRLGGDATKGFEVVFGKIGLKACEGGKLTKKQVESARIVVMRTCARKGKLFMRKNIFFPVTKKPLEVRMGGGKGSIEFYATRVRAGAILFELDNVPLDLAYLALTKASYKLNIPCKVVYRKFVDINS